MDCTYLSLAEVQGELYKLLCDFDELCRTHGIRYSLDCGTLLGAIRHQGFIPWDDDIDVIVPRPDYEKLLAHPEWLDDGHFVVSTQGDPDYLFPFAKFCTKAFRAQEGALLGAYEEYLWIDLFPLDGVPDDDDAALALCMEQKKRTAFATRLCVNIDEIATSPLKLFAKKLAFPILRTLFSARKEYEKIAQVGKSIPYESSERVGNVTWVVMGKKRWFAPEEMDNLIRVPFCDGEFPVIPGWDAYLTGLYGDYMQLPPVEQRKTHGVKVWKA